MLYYAILCYTKNYFSLQSENDSHSDKNEQFPVTVKGQRRKKRKEEEKERKGREGKEINSFFNFHNKYKYKTG